jgi:hypothetical protein
MMNSHLDNRRDETSASVCSQEPKDVGLPTRTELVQRAERFRASARKVMAVALVCLGLLHLAQVILWASPYKRLFVGIVFALMFGSLWFWARKNCIRCPHCRRPLIDRTGHLKDAVLVLGKCPRCGKHVTSDASD